jgi:hypothetical protein
VKLAPPATVIPLPQPPVPANLAVMRTHAWAHAFPVLVETTPATIFDALAAFVPDAGPDQHAAWRASVTVLQTQGAHVLRLCPSASEHSAVLEYELPREGGRRPDVVVLQNGTVAVLEFKSAAQPRRADLDQVAAYARDLMHYHSACQDVRVVAVLVLPERRVLEAVSDHVYGLTAGAEPGRLAFVRAAARDVCGPRHAPT